MPLEHPEHRRLRLEIRSLQGRAKTPAELRQLLDLFAQALPLCEGEEKAELIRCQRSYGGLLHEAERPGKDMTARREGTCQCGGAFAAGSSIRWRSVGSGGYVQACPACRVTP